MAKKRQDNRSRRAAPEPKRRPKRQRTSWQRNDWLILLAVLAIPLGTFWVRPYIPAPGSPPEVYKLGKHYAASPVSFVQGTIGPTPRFRPRITNVQTVDFDEDGTLEVLACDAVENRVLLYRQTSPGEWEQQVLGENLTVPAHATVVDIDADGDRDVVVAILGDIFPNDSIIGSVELLENHDGQFTRRTLLDNVRRVADVQAGDLDGDGDVDLAVAVFGYARGQVLWLENLGEGRFTDHELLSAPGTIHVPLADYDGDGDLDVAAVVSQDEEEVWGFENLGQGNFRSRLLFTTPNFDIGSSGLVETDLDGDGDQDLLLPVGDNFDNISYYPKPYDGCLWLENRGDWTFEARRISDFGGTYAAAAGDIDGDGDRDVVLVSMCNEWSDPQNASIIWLENDGKQNFTPWQMASSPIHMTTVACGDLNGDGRDDVVAGGLHTPLPYERIGRITTWITTGSEQP